MIFVELDHEVNPGLVSCLFIVSDINCTLEWSYHIDYIVGFGYGGYLDLDKNC